MANGGARPGSGRKTKADELKVQNLARGALIAKYGSEEKAFEALLETKEPSLLKFVYEHAFGKPREKVDMDNSGQLTLRIIRGDKPAS